MTTRKIRLPKKLIPVFDGPADVRGAFGGRGSGKTRSFAKMIATRGMVYGQDGVSGILLCARQFMNSLDDSSLEECKRAIEEEPFLAAYYEVGEKYIKSRDGRISFAFAGLDRNIASIKSKGRILICWVDEAEPVTDGAFDTLDPTLREEGTDGAGDAWNAELWVTWNPARKGSAVDKKYRNTKDPMTKVVELNWRDNPKFPDVLERKRAKCLVEDPDQYEHIWEGAYKTVVEGAYFTKQLIQAKQQGRIGRVAADPLMTIRLFADIGGTGARADNFVFVACQFIGREIRVVNHYEQQGQPIEAHLIWLRAQGYVPGKAQIWLPHDGDTQDKVHDVSYRSAFEAAGYAVEVIPNQGKGAAMLRVEAARRLFNACWFEEEPTQPLRDALGWYHEKRDAERGIGLGPNHDWASHSADAFGLMCVAYETPADKPQALVYPSRRTA
jgi:phage terminase large subunit